MPKLSPKTGTSSKIVRIFIQDTSSTTGSGLAGITYASAGLTAYYSKEGDTTSTAITLVATTPGVWASGGFVAVDATNMQGVYELGLPNSVLVSGKSVLIFLKGVTNMAPTPFEFELTAVDNQSATNFVTSVPSVVAPVTTTFAVKKNTALPAFEFALFSSTDHVTPKSGLGAAVTATRSIDGAAFAACANTVAEVSGGIYSLNLAAADLNGNVITLQFVGTGADVQFVTIVTQ